MKTSALIRLLATNPEPVQTRPMANSLAWSLVLGSVISIIASGVAIGFLPSRQFLLPVVWAKFAYAAALVLTQAVLLARLCSPGAPARDLVKWPLLVLLAMVAMGFMALIMAPPDQRAMAIFGQTWLVCPWAVLGLSMPALMVFLGWARRMAPTDLKSAGFTAGLLAGATGAFGYSFACPEVSLSFVAIWYTAGIVLAGLVGRALGPRVLRW